jgi:hypothetical protein
MAGQAGFFNYEGMNMKAYKWGARRFKTAAEIAAAEMRRVADEVGELTAESLVEESRPEDAPLHDEFEWNNEICGDRYRRYQASTMIRSLVAIETDRAPARVYVGVPNESDQSGPISYHDMQVVITRPDYFAAALGRLVSQVREAQSSVDELANLARVDSDQPDRMAAIVLASKALDAVTAAVAHLH